MNVIVFGAHPDDCEFGAGGTAARLVQAGHSVKFVSVTNGNAGHMSRAPGELARIRRGEAERAAEALGVQSEVLDIHDCHLVPTVEVRERLMGLIREWNADIVITHRPYDYHPDHRAVGTAVQDTAYLAMVPLFCPEVPALSDNPVYLYVADRFSSPQPFRADLIVPIDEVLELKIEALNCMPSQLYEWLPWIDHNPGEVPSGALERKAFIRDVFLRRDLNPSLRQDIERQYGRAVAAGIEFFEAFQLCEYGRQPLPAELHAMVPGLPGRIDL